MPSRLKFLTGLVTFTVILRLLPYFILNSSDHTTNPWSEFYPWNFMPLTALCLYSGATFTNKLWSVAPPLIAQFVSDLGIWAVTGQFSKAFPNEMWSVYVCYLIAVLLGSGLHQRAWPNRGFSALGRGVLAEAIFFVVVDFVYFWNQTDLPHTPAGLIACYVAAIPFYGKSFLSTAFYSVLFFSPLAESAAGESNRTQNQLSSAQIQ